MVELEKAAKQKAEDEKSLEVSSPSAQSSDNDESSFRTDSDIEDKILEVDSSLEHSKSLEEELKELGFDSRKGFGNI